MGAITDLLLQVRGEDVSGGRTLEELGAELQAFGSIEAEAEALVDTGSSTEELRKLTADVDEFGRKRVQATAGITTGEARAELDALAADVDEFGRKREEATLTVDTSRGRAEADALEARLRAVRGEGTLDINVARAAAKIDAFRAAAGRDVEMGVDVNLNEAQLSKLVAARAAVEAVTSAGSAGGSGGGAGGIGGLFQELPLVGGLSSEAAGAVTAVLIPAITSLIAFLGALVASAAAAAAGLGALGAAAIAAFGPVAALAAAAVFQITKASTAQTAYASANQAAKSAAEGVTSAEASLQNAQDQRRQAVEALARAQHDAAVQIRSDQLTALDQLRSAQEGLTTADYQAKTAEDALTLARQAARRALVDERLAAEGAALGHQDAAIQLAQARQQLRELESQRGQAGGPSALDIRAARQAVRDAEFQLDQTRVQSTRAQKDLSTAEQQGVSQNPQVVQARHDLADAEQAQRDAVQKLNEAEAANRRAQAETVARSPSVISAQQGVKSATQQVADAQRQVNTATERYDYAAKKAQKAQAALARTGSGLEVIRAARRAMTELQSATEPVVRGIARGLRSLGPLLRELRPELHALGEAMGNAFVRFFRELERPGWQRFFRLLLRNSAELTRVGSRGFILMLRIIRNIVQAGLPYLVAGLRDLNHWLAGVARDSKNIDLSGVVHALGAWLKLSYALGRVFLSFVRDAAGAGNNLVDMLTRGLNAWADWLDSAGGKNRLAQFFKDTLPLAKDLLALTGQLAITFLELGQFLAPILDPFVQALTIIVRWVNRILDLFNKIPGPIRQALVAIGNPAFAFVLALKLIDRVAGSVFGALPALARGAFRGLRTATSAVGDFLGGAWRGIRTVAEAVWGGIKDAITGPPKEAFHWLRTAVSNIVGWLGDHVADMAGPFEDVAGKIVDAFHVIKGPLVDAVNWIIDNVINRIPGVQIDTIDQPAAAGKPQPTPKVSRAYTRHHFARRQGGGAIGHDIRRAAHLGEDAVGNILHQFQSLHRPGGLFGFLPGWMKGLGGWIWHSLLDAAKSGAGDVGKSALDLLSPLSNPGGSIAHALGIQGGGFAGKVGGTGTGDKIPFLAEPGEGLWYVLNRKAMAALEWLNGAVPRFQTGGAPGGAPGAVGLPAPAGAPAQQADLRGLATYRRRTLAILDALRVGALALWRDLWTGIEKIQRASQGDALGTSRDFTAALTKDWRTLRDDARTIWRDVGQAILIPLQSTFQKIEHDALPELDRRFRETSLDVARLFTGAGRVVGRVAQYIVDAVNKLVGALGNKKAALPDIHLPNLPDPSSLVPGHFRGGIVTTPSYRVGEEAPQHREVVLTENPAHRERNVGLWAAAGRMLGVPGFARGGFTYPFPQGPPPSGLGRTDEGVDVSGPGTPIAAIGDAVVTSLSNYFSSSGFGGPGQGLVYKLLGGAPKGYAPSSPWIYIFEDFNRRVGGGRLSAGQIVGSIASGSFGIETGWAASGSGQPLAQTTGGIDPVTHYSPAGASFVRFITDLAKGKAISGGAAIRALIPQIDVKGKGAVVDAVQAAVDTMRGAANDYLSRIESRVAGAAAALPPGVAKGSVAQQAFKAARSAHAHHKATLALFEALFAESGMGTTSANVLQLTGTKLGGIGPGSSPAAQAFAFLTRGWGYQDPQYGDVGGAIHGAGIVPIASRLAQAVQGSAFSSGSNYQAQEATAETLLRRMGYPGFAGGGRLARAMLGLLGGEPGRGELALLPSGTEVLPADITSRLTDALMGRPAKAGAGLGAGGDGNGAPAGLGDLRVVINGDVVSDHPEPVQAFIGDRKVAGWVRDIAAEEARDEYAHGARMEAMSR